MPVHSRVTSRTRLAPALLAILAILTILDDYQGWRFLLLGLGGAWLLSRWWAHSLADQLSLKREMRFGWAQVGDRLEQRFTLVNQARVPAPWVELEDHSDLPGARENLVTGVESHSSNSWQKTYLCQQRGLFSLGPTSLHTSDPLGLFEVEVDDPSRVSLLVTPPIVPLPRIEVAPGGRAGEGKPRPHSLEQTISASGARPYQQGDGLRWVHWPTTARRDELYVRTFESRPSGDWWILLDCDQSVQVGEGEQSTLEHGVILAASLADRGLRQGQAVGLAAHGRELVWHPPRQGDGQRLEILQSLARLQPAATPAGRPDRADHRPLSPGCQPDPDHTQYQRRLAGDPAAVAVAGQRPDRAAAGSGGFRRPGRRATAQPAAGALGHPPPSDHARPAEPARGAARAKRPAGIPGHTDRPRHPGQPAARSILARLLMIVDALARLVMWSLRKVGVRALVYLACLVVIFGDIVTGLNASLTDLESLNFYSIVLAALLVSWWLARSKRSGRQAALVLTGLGLALIAISAGGLGNPFFALARAGLQYAWTALHWHTGEPTARRQISQPTGRRAGLAAQTLLEREANWIAAAAAQAEPGQDGVTRHLEPAAVVDGELVELGGAPPGEAAGWRCCRRWSYLPPACLIPGQMPFTCSRPCSGR